MTDLNTLVTLPLGVTLLEATAVNDSGQIAANASSGHAYLLTPLLPSFGAINVTTNLADARFTITGPVTYNGNGTSFTQTGAPVGTYTLTYRDVPKYIAPPGQTLTLHAGQILTFPEGVYLPVTISACLIGSPGCTQSVSFSYQQGIAGPILPKQIAISTNGPSIPFVATASRTRQMALAHLVPG